MKKFTFLLLIIFPFIGISQNNNLIIYQDAKSLLESNEIDKAYLKFKELESTLTKSDTLYDYALWFKVLSGTYLEKVNRMQEKFDKSLEFAVETLSDIEKNALLFEADYTKRKYFMMKNIVVGNYGVENFQEGKHWKEKLYEANAKNLLPDGLDGSFNFDYFKFEDKNIWGYEWFAELPEDRFSTSFTKVLYYVYSTNPDGSDKDQLYRLHVLMFHGSDQKFDYVLDKRLENAAGNEISGTLYAYTYKEDIDFEKLKNDVKAVLKGNLKPDTTRTTTTDKDGKVKVEIKY